MQHNLLKTGTIIILLSFAIMSCNQSDKSKTSQKDSTDQKTEIQKNESNDKDKNQDNDSKNNQPAPVSNELDFLRAMDGKYPAEVKLLDNPVIIARLKNLLGARLTFLKKTWAVETPIEVKNDLFIASGCEQHNCGSTNFIIVAYLDKNKMYAGIREDEHVSTYSEDGTIAPEIKKWSGLQ